MKKFIKLSVWMLFEEPTDGMTILSEAEITDDEIKEIFPVIEAIKAGPKYDRFIHDTSLSFDDDEDCDEDIDFNFSKKSAKQLYGNIKGYDLFVKKFVPVLKYGLSDIFSIEIIECTKIDKLL